MLTIDERTELLRCCLIAAYRAYDWHKHERYMHDVLQTAAHGPLTQSTNDYTVFLTTIATGLHYAMNNYIHSRTLDPERAKALLTVHSILAAVQAHHIGYTDWPWSGVALNDLFLKYVTNILGEEVVDKVLGELT